MDYFPPWNVSYHGILHVMEYFLSWNTPVLGYFPYLEYFPLTVKIPGHGMYPVVESVH